MHMADALLSPPVAVAMYAASAAAEHLVEKIHLSADEIQSAEQYDKVNYFPYDIHLRTIPPFP